MGSTTDRSARILLVDDDPCLLEALPEAIRLRLPAVEVDTLLAGRDAIERMTEERYDALVIDLMMPDMKGTEVVARVKGIAPWLPVIFITGNLTLPREVELLRPFACLHKPIDRKFLAETLQRALRYGRVTRRLLRRARIVQEHAQRAEELHARVTAYLAKHPALQGRAEKTD